MTRHRLVQLLLVAWVGVIAGCGGTATTGGTSREPAAAVRSDRGMIRFARCMRAHGVNMRDPFHRPGHDGLSIDLPEQGPATRTAYGVCGHYLQATIELKEGARAQVLTPAVHVALIHYAQCMRSRDIAMLDPGPLGQLSLGNVPGITNDIGRYTPQFHLADQQCRHLLPASIHDDGTGP